MDSLRYRVGEDLGSVADSAAETVVLAQRIAPTAAALLNGSLQVSLGSARSMDAVNATAASLCSTNHAPSLPEYIRAVDAVGEVLFSAGAVVVVLVLLIYVDTLRHVLRRSPVPALPAPAKSHTAFVISVYPVVSLATLCAVVVPRAQLLAEAVTQGVFMAAVYQLWCLLVAYCGGEAELIRRVKPGSLNPRVGPCCCWPCCLLPQLPVNKRNVCLLRLLVLQLPLVQVLLYLVLLVMWAEEESLYQVNYMYLQPVVVISILLGIWGLLMTIKMLTSVLAGHLIPAKFLALQAVLLLAKFQALAAKALAWYRVLPCHPPLTPNVYANLIYNFAMLVEMLLLSLLARALYTRELPDMNMRPSPASPAPTQVCVIEAARVENHTKDLTDVRPSKESNNNDSTNNDNRQTYKF